MALSKKTRFAIFARDGFTCRYCGRNSESTTLEVDHLHPRSKGGTDDPSNLVTACFDCNRGKSDAVISSAPSVDYLQMAQELREQQALVEALKERDLQDRERFEAFIDQFRSVAGNAHSHMPTMRTLYSYTKEHGSETVFEWIMKAINVTIGTDAEIGRYVSGIRRSIKGGAL